MSSNDTRRQQPPPSASANQRQPLGKTLHSKRPREEDARHPLAALSPNVNVAKRRREPQAARPASKTQEGLQANAALSTVDHPSHAEVEDDYTYEDDGTTDDDIDEYCFGDITDEEYAELCDDIPDKDDEEEAGEPSPTVSPAVSVVDQHGHIRVGPQPMVLRPFVRTAAAKTAHAHLRERIRGNLNYMDSTFVSRQDAELQKKEMLDDMPRWLFTYRPGHVYAVCDYTGLDVSWAPGPYRMSVEAIYPFAVVDSRVLYHARSNTGYILATLNWLKRKHPILVLPLLGMYLRTHQEPDFQVRKVTWTSTYTALLNVSVMNKIFHCTLRHTAQINQWEKWSLEKQRAVLEHLRTGVFGPVIQDQVRDWTISSLFMKSNFIFSAPTAHGYWKKVYRWLIRIAQKHGITRDEFEYYATVSAPDSPNERVFFPFHVLAKAQAEGMSWNWCTIFGFAQTMLLAMRDGCNRHAEKAGYGEQEMDPLRLIYWWCHHLCKKIQRVKSERPSGTPEEISFYLLDRWGLPVVPWTGNILRASLCKDQDHGIAMRFGLCLPGNGEDFDPVEHWDDCLCTVTIDSQATNMAMREYDTATWDSIRDALSRVPCSHPFWSVDADLGLRCWVSDWDEPLATRPLPIPVPAMPLVPIDPWLSAAASPQHYQCSECPSVVNVPTAGLLLRHYQDKHWGDSTMAGPTDAEQDAIDEAYWEDLKERLRCKEPGCGRSFTTIGSLRRHTGLIHVETRRQFPCEQPGCDKVYLDAGGLRGHIRDKHAAIPQEYPCQEPGCGRIYVNAANLHHHSLIHAAGPGGFPCPEPDCGKTYSSPNSLHEHVKTRHSEAPPSFNCTELGCTKTFTAAGSLRRHVAEMHATVATQFKCKESGCARVYTSADNLRRHVRDDHAAVPKVHKCEAPNCGKTFSNSSNLRAHTKVKHSTETLSFVCPESGCGKSFNRNSNLRAHIKANHPERAAS